ncbi:MAG: hypothetical protein A2Z04_02640 [Chloroflexi bacterium RBG_16_57_9]|nr:MAG: hypothetical protein A2Z04_02640 [Chloroflexi bacterium RBG_16_57_9]
MLDDFREYIQKLDHTAIAVHRIRDALLLYRDILGGTYYLGGTETGQGFRWAQFIFPGGNKIELLEPTNDNGFLAHFLRKHGEGVHHITFKVHRLEELVVRLKERGLRIVGEYYADPLWKEAFIPPGQAHGTIIQLAESPMPDSEAIKLWRPELDELLLNSSAAY